MKVVEGAGRLEEIPFPRPFVIGSSGFSLSLFVCRENKTKKRDFHFALLTHTIARLAIEIKQSVLPL